MKRILLLLHLTVISLFLQGYSGNVVSKYTSSTLDREAIKITTRKEFETNFESIRKELGLVRDSKASKDAYTLKLNEVYVYAHQKGTLEQQRICEAYIIFNTSESKSYEDIIVEIKKLIIYEDIKLSNEYHHLLHLLKTIYAETEQNYEIIKLIPEYYKSRQSISPNDNWEHEKYRDLGLAFYQVGNYEEAIASFKEYYSATAEQDFMQKAGAHNDIGLCYAKLDQVNSAMVNFKLAQKFCSRVEGHEQDYASYFYWVIEANKVNLNLSTQDYQVSQRVYKQQLQGATFFREYNIIQNSYLELSKIAFKQGNIQMAFDYLDSLKPIFKMYKNHKHYEATLSLAGKYNLWIGNKNEAEKFFNMAVKFSDSVQTQRSKYAFANAAAQYESEEAKKALNAVKKEVAVQKGIARYQRNGMILFAIGVLIMAFLVRSEFIAKRKVKRQNLVVTKTLSERELLLQEIHHRVKNNLQVISGLLQLQSLKVKNPDDVLVLNESRQYVYSMSLVHELLYEGEDLGNINMQEYLIRLVSSISGRVKDGGITMEVRAEQIMLPLDKAVTIGIICTELVTNSVKHAFEDGLGNISITIDKLSSSFFKFVYYDSGKGFLATDHEIRHKTLGVKLIKMLAEQLDAEQELQSPPGFCLTLKFKAE